MLITDTLKKLLEKCAFDIVGPLPITNAGNKYILTFQDKLTKFSKAISIKNQEANTVAKAFVTKIIVEYEIPDKILTDQGFENREHGPEHSGNESCDHLNFKSWQLIIKSINIPATVKVNGTDYIILDCDYDLENTSSKGLVVKWFFNTNQVVYQWIYGRNPLADEPAAKYIDLTYKASDDPYTEYRAIKLNKPGIDLTGEYTCVISTFADERTANASMIVYSTEEKFDLIYKKRIIDDKDGVEITCAAEGLYPQPTLEISVENIPKKQTENFAITLRDDGLYNILSRIALLDEDLPETTIIKCLLGISKASYKVSRKTVYYTVGIGEED
ncbi:uncharacterized protein LOC105432862 [Pogonomyrmex barbatus]|uniref:Uncharacterized protein LOC105432862 n=1 Tax=Pogonomyrmex barbatus TaxID=144034 RepID=A0A6I9WQT0_9HYME|nr:uncharacterized protein LOC105432862 [Pogonomyrmex barbatus]